MPSEQQGPPVGPFWSDSAVIFGDADKLVETSAVSWPSAPTAHADRHMCGIMCHSEWSGKLHHVQVHSLAARMKVVKT